MSGTIEKPKICYSYPAFKKCFEWVHGARTRDGKPSEVSWSGLVEVQRNFYSSGIHRFLITDCFLWPGQVVSTSGVNTNTHLKPRPGVMGELFERLDATGVDLATLNHFGHSHASLAVGQSSDDRENVLEAYGFGEKWTRQEPNRQFCVAVTWNVRGEMYGELTVFEPVPYRIEGVPVEYELPMAGVETAAKEELAASLILDEAAPLRLPSADDVLREIRRPRGKDRDKMKRALDASKVDDMDIDSQLRFFHAGKSVRMWDKMFHVQRSGLAMFYKDNTNRTQAMQVEDIETQRLVLSALIQGYKGYSDGS